MNTITIKSFVVGLFQTNMYVLSDAEGHIMIVDPACQTPAEQQEVLTYISTIQSQHPSFQDGENSPSVSIIATHGHLDHLWGAAWACEHFNTSVWMHAADIPMAQAMQAQYDMFGMRAKAQAFPITDIKNCVAHTIFNLQILETPGHTQGSICLYHKKQSFLLSGDTLFCCGYGRTDLPGGNMEQLIQSLERLFQLPANTDVLSGHGETTTIGHESKY